MLNKYGDNTEPCLTPKFTSDTDAYSCTYNVGCLSVDTAICYKLECFINFIWLFVHIYRLQYSQHIRVSDQNMQKLWGCNSTHAIRFVEVSCPIQNARGKESGRRAESPRPAVWRRSAGRRSRRWSIHINYTVYSPTYVCRCGLRGRGALAPLWMRNCRWMRKSRRPSLAARRQSSIPPDSAVDRKHRRVGLRLTSLSSRCAPQTMRLINRLQCSSHPQTNRDNIASVLHRLIFVYILLHTFQPQIMRILIISKLAQWPLKSWLNLIRAVVPPTHRTPVRCFMEIFISPEWKSGSKQMRKKELN